MSSRFTKKSLVSDPGVEVRTPTRGLPGVRAQHPQAADEHGHLGRAQGQQVRAVDQQVLRRQPGALRRGSCGTRPRPARARRRTPASVCSCVASVRPGVNGTATSWPAFRAACSTAAAPAEHDEVGQRDPPAPSGEPLNDSWIPSRVRSTCASASGSLTSQPRCGSRRMRAPFAPPRRSLMRNVEADAHAVATSWETDSPESRIRRLERGDVRRRRPARGPRRGRGPARAASPGGTSGPR